MEQRKDENIVQQIADYVDNLEEENKRKVFEYAQNAVEIEQNCKSAMATHRPQFD